MLIDRSKKTPVYRQIYDDINERIQRGEYSLGSMLPSENKLCAIYGVERATVRRALALMVEDGKIAKIPGTGTSVLNPAGAAPAVPPRSLLFLLPRGARDADRISEPFNAKLLETMERECAEAGYHLLYKSFAGGDGAEDLLLTCNPCGVFFTSSLPAEMVRQLHRRGIPVVLVNQNHPLYPSVCMDNRGGAKMVVESLVALEHREIGFVCGLPDDQIQSSRFSGFKEALEASGVPLNPAWILPGDWSMESGRAAMRRLLDAGKPPTALFAANDAMAIGALAEAADSGLCVPGDISVAGFDNIDQARYVRPALTTVAVDYDGMARAACMLMVDMIGHGNCELNVNIYVSLKMVDRESTGKANTRG